MVFWLIDLHRFSVTFLVTALRILYIYGCFKFLDFLDTLGQAKLSVMTKTKPSPCGEKLHLSEYVKSKITLRSLL